MNIFLTGATGLLGGELLVNLSKHKDVKKIVCLVRGATEKEAVLRIEKVFSLHNDYYDKEKVKVVIGDLDDVNLTNSLLKVTEIKDTNVIIHSAANTSFSRIYDTLVEKVNMHGLNKVIQWAKHLDNLSTFLYIGTATICGKDKKNGIIYEKDSPNVNATHLVKYTYTKMMGELMLQKEFPPEKLLVARPSIILGDSRPVIARSPVILWALATINARVYAPFIRMHTLIWFPWIIQQKPSSNFYLQKEISMFTTSLPVSIISLRLKSFQLSSTPTLMICHPISLFQNHT